MPSGQASGLITPQVMNKVHPHLASIFDQVERGLEVQGVLQSVAMETGLSAAQVARYVQAVIVAAERHKITPHPSFA